MATLPYAQLAAAPRVDTARWFYTGMALLVALITFLGFAPTYYLDGHLPREVDLFYTNDGEPPFADEMRGIADRHASLHLHLIDTEVEGRLTTEQVLETAGCDPRTLSVFMCGPPGMLRTFESGLRLAGVPSRRIHREHFDWR